MSSPPVLEAFDHGPRGLPAPSKELLHRLRRAFTVVVAAAVTGCAQTGDRDARITAPELQAHVKYLASKQLEGRLPGTAGYDSAAAYVARVLAQSAVIPAGTMGTDEGSYFQPVPLERNRIGEGTALVLRTSKGTKRLPYGRRTFLLLAPGQGSRAMAARPPVFVGNGLHAPEYGVDDLAGLDLKGRAVLLTATPPGPAELAGLPEPVRRAYADPATAQLRRLRDIIERGAAAILLLPDRWLIDEWDQVSAQRHQLDYSLVGSAASEGPASPIPAAVLHADLVDRLFLGRGYHPISHVGRYHTFELSGISLRLEVDIRREPLKTANVIGVVPGRDRSLRHQYVLVSAHLDGLGRDGDRIFFGANDAAACAALLEAAAAIAKHPPRRSVLFVLFTAEEGGSWGSRYFLAHSPVPPDAVVAAIQLGQLGQPTTGSGTIRALTTPALAEPTQAAAVQVRGATFEVETITGQPDVLRGTIGEVFSAHGIPSVLLTGTGARDVHIAGGTPARVDSQRLLETTLFLRRLIAQTADDRSLAPQRQSQGDAPG